MKKIKILNRFLIIVVSLCSIFLALTSGDGIYGSLIKLSVIPVLLLPYIIEKISKNKLNDYLIIIYTIFITLAHFLGSIVNLYHKIYWYDSFAHFLSGILVAIIATYILVILKKYEKHSYVFNLLFILGVSFMVAGMWEIFEFTSDNIFSKDAQNALTTGVTDTMKDIILAAAGTLLYCILYLYEELNEKTIIIKRFIKSI